METGDLEQLGFSRKVAALFVQKGGAYFGLPDVDPWDQERDARLYSGPWPVVAHPPCQRWCTMARCVEVRFPHLRVGDDGGCFASALASVRRVGGVLEHPAYSFAFGRFDLGRPKRGSWQPSAGGWITELSQSAYGHKAQKRTWLYYAGDPPPALDWSNPEGTHRIGSGGGKVGRYQPDGSVKRVAYRVKKPNIGQREADATPAAFKAVLLELARGAR